MILVDANLLIYATTKSMNQHEAAKAWLDARLSEARPVGIPWPSILAFLRIVTNPRLFERALPIADAWQQVNSWLAADCTWIPLPTEEHAALLGRMLPVATNPDLVPDAHLAALALEHGLTVYSTDGDFARFPGVNWENPLAAPRESDN
jgi:toxin-antitoxin system PIN domain toxin